MSYKMSYKVRSLLFFFGFVIASLVYYSVEEQQLAGNEQNQEEQNISLETEKSDLDLSETSTIVTID